MERMFSTSVFKTISNLSICKDIVNHSFQYVLWVNDLTTQLYDMQSEKAPLEYVTRLSDISENKDIHVEPAVRNKQYVEQPFVKFSNDLLNLIYRKVYSHYF